MSLAVLSWPLGSQCRVSSPESLGCFFSKPEVGIGKMVGSINFNILVLVGKKRICTFDFMKHLQLFNSASFMQDMRD